MAAFSRLQLAAALIEYDNDDTDPDAPRVSAHDSAIFAHLRRNNHRLPIAARTSDYLGVALPTEPGSDGGRDSEQDRKSRASSDALRNPFGRDSTYGDLEMKEEDMEVDLASWGLDALMPHDRPSKRNKAKSGALPNPHPQVVSPRPGDNRRRADGNRSASLGNIDMFGEGGAFLEAGSSVINAPAPRRHSIGDPLDAAGLDHPPPLAVRQRRASEHFPIENLPVTPPLHAVPFPSAISIRSSPPFPGYGPNTRAAHIRTLSTASMAVPQQIEPQNPFEIKPPSPDRASRFDPKADRSRTLSQGTMGTLALQNVQGGDARGLRIEQRDRIRTVSAGTLGSQRSLGDDDGAASAFNGQPGRERLYSRAELMRPKLLVMPSPLQSVVSPVQTLSLPSVSREGFSHSSDGRPLPPGARTGVRRASSTLSILDPSGSLEAPIASNSFTPNPRMSLSLSQLTFRNTLMVDGSRDVAYADIDSRLKRATEDGEQVAPDLEPDVVPTVIVDGPSPDRRAPGKLLGRSLIDDLEARKAEMKGKQRTFTGDSRPSMMARSNLQRSSTLIDPESLKRPASQNLNTLGADLQRRNSKGKTLINFDEEIPGARKATLGVNSQQRNGNAKSVFGVDTLWERELVKLREIEERERAEEEAQARKDAEDQTKREQKRGRGKRKGKDQPESVLFADNSQQDLVKNLHTPPILPDIQKASAPRRAPSPSGDDESNDSISDASSVVQRTGAKAPEDWYAGSSDEDRGPRRTIGTGPRYSTRKASQPMRAVASDSEEDVPLVATIGRAVERATKAQSQAALNSDSDEEKPLSVLLNTKLRSPSLAATSHSASSNLFPGPRLKAEESEDEDDQPLGLRASRVMLSPADMLSGGEDDDDKPLAFHPDQLRRTQYVAMQQQQFMMQAAQMHQSMMFGAPSIMGSGFFGPAMAPPMMMAAQSPMLNPAANEAAKYGRVDKWRHDVAVEGLPPS